MRRHGASLLRPPDDGCLQLKVCRRQVRLAAKSMRALAAGVWVRVVGGVVRLEAVGGPAALIRRHVPLRLSGRLRHKASRVASA